VEKSKIINVCIDDFALKKRQRYGTVMVNVENHKIVDMIESRETEDVRRWLSEYPNICIVSRDGSQQYAMAITQAHPTAMQVSDRFHLFKNLNRYATDAFQKLFQGRIAIPVTPGTQNIRYDILIGTKAERVRLVKKLRGEGHTKDAIVLLTGLSLKMLNNYINIQECDVPKEKPTDRGRGHEEAVKKLLERSERVKILKDSGLSITEIAQKTGFTAAIVKRYLSADFNPVNAHYGKQREGKLELFRASIIQWRADGLKYREIHERIKEKGYIGTQDAIRVFISKERRVRRDLQAMIGGEPVEFVDKKWLIRLLYKPIEDIKGISAEQLGAIYSSYPSAKIIFDIVNEFKTLVKNKKSDVLFPWMEKVCELGIPELNAFVGGLRQDIDAVINAITIDFNNGLVEGTINKIKVIKRIMYGRCRFDLLRNKCLLLDNT